MDAKYYKILVFLKQRGVGEFDNISPILQELYPGISGMDFDRAIFESNKINHLLASLNRERLIDLKGYSLGSGNRTNGIDWIDTVNIQAAITQKGITVIEDENNKGESARLIESTILTNESVRETNSATRQNLSFQKTSQIYTIILGALSTVFILVTVIQKFYDNTEQSLQGIKEIMQIQSQRTQKLDSSLQELKTSIEKRKIDTVYVIQK